MPILTTTEHTKRFTELAHHYAELESRKKELADDMKACADLAKNELGVPPKALKQAAKELGMDSVERMAQRELEDALDACRLALGLLADTPLGQAAQEDYGTHSDEPARRGPGRPKGSRNKSKRSEFTEELAQVADAPPPAVPDEPMDPFTAGDANAPAWPQ